MNIIETVAKFRSDIRLLEKEKGLTYKEFTIRCNNGEKVTQEDFGEVEFYMFDDGTFYYE